MVVPFLCDVIELAIFISAMDNAFFKAPADFMHILCDIVHVWDIKLAISNRPIGQGYCL